VTWESSDTDVSLNPIPTSEPFGSFLKSDVFYRNWRYLGTGWTEQNPKVEAWRRDVLHFTTKFLEER